MPRGMAPLGIGNSVIAPAGVILAILLPRGSLNQRLPSGPTVICSAVTPGVGIAYSLNVTCAGHMVARISPMVPKYAFIILQHPFENLPVFRLCWPPRGTQTVK